jgi:hypothetical protein
LLSEAFGATAHVEETLDKVDLEDATQHDENALKQRPEVDEIVVGN